MTLAILLLFFGGVALEGLFSGCETGFYRVSRMRLMIDAVGGSRIARGLLWLTANPSLFVATTQVVDPDRRIDEHHAPLRLARWRRRGAALSSRSVAPRAMSCRPLSLAISASSPAFKTAALPRRPVSC